MGIDGILRIGKSGSDPRGTVERQGRGRRRGWIRCLREGQAPRRGRVEVKFEDEGEESGAERGRAAVASTINHDEGDGDDYDDDDDNETEIEDDYDERDMAEDGDEASASSGSDVLDLSMAFNKSIRGDEGVSDDGCPTGEGGGYCEEVKDPEDESGAGEGEFDRVDKNEIKKEDTDEREPSKDLEEEEVSASTELDVLKLSTAFNKSMNISFGGEVCDQGGDCGEEESDKGEREEDTYPLEGGYSSFTAERNLVSGQVLGGSEFDGGTEEGGVATIDYDDEADDEETVSDESSAPSLISAPLAAALDVSEMSSFVEEGSNNQIDEHVGDREVDLSNAVVEGRPSIIVTPPVAMNNDGEDKGNDEGNKVEENDGSYLSVLDASYTPSHIVGETSSTVNLSVNLSEISDSDEEDDKDDSSFSSSAISCDSDEYEDEYDSIEEEDGETIINPRSAIKRKGEKLLSPASSVELDLGGLTLEGDGDPLPSSPPHEAVEKKSSSGLPCFQSSPESSSPTVLCLDGDDNFLVPARPPPPRRGTLRNVRLSLLPPPASSIMNLNDEEESKNKEADKDEDRPESAWTFDSERDEYFLKGGGENQWPSVRLTCELFDKLYDHQKVGVQWIASLHKGKLGGILGDDMGLGEYNPLLFVAS